MSCVLILIETFLSLMNKVDYRSIMIEKSKRHTLRIYSIVNSEDINYFTKMYNLMCFNT